MTQMKAHTKERRKPVEGMHGVGSARSHRCGRFMNSSVCGLSRSAGAFRKARIEKIPVSMSHQIFDYIFREEKRKISNPKMRPRMEIVIAYVFNLIFTMLGRERGKMS